MIRSLPIVFGACVAIAAGQPTTAPLQRGIASLEAGEFETALRDFEAAAVRTDDPGFVAYHRGLALAKLGRIREAEIQFERCLDDTEISPERRAKALYNLGLCLLARGELATLRAAIERFTACRDFAVDETLRADAAHNVEVAKVRWLQARAKQSEPQSPNDSRPEASPQATKNDPGTGTGTKGNAGDATPTPTTGSVEKTAAASKTTKLAPGAGTLPVLRDESTLTPLSVDDTRAYLEQASKRLAKQRQAIDAERAGPDRPSVRDW